MSGPEQMNTEALDDAMVDALVADLAAALKAKLARARAKGRGGWQDPAACSVRDLWDMLIEHARKPNLDMVDVAALAGMIRWRLAHVIADPAILAEHVAVRAAEQRSVDLTSVAEDAALSTVTLRLDRLAQVEEWTAEVVHDRVTYEGRGDTPEEALVEAIVETQIANYYYRADMDAPAMTTAEMTRWLHHAYQQILGYLPEHGYRGSYLRQAAVQDVPVRAIEPQTLGHRLLWLAGMAGFGPAPLARYQVACMPHDHPSNTEKALRELVRRGLLHLEGGRYALTPAGAETADQLGRYLHE